MTPTVLVGYVAASLVFATFCTKRIMPLRALAIASNIASIGCGYLGELWPFLILHAVMLQLNIHCLRREMLLECPSSARSVAAPTATRGLDRSDAFLGLMHTCRKLGIPSWDYLDHLGARLPIVPNLPDLIRCG